MRYIILINYLFNIINNFLHKYNNSLTFDYCFIDIPKMFLLGSKTVICHYLLLLTVNFIRKILLNFRQLEYSCLSDHRATCMVVAIHSHVGFWVLKTMPKNLIGRQNTVQVPIIHNEWSLSRHRVSSCLSSHFTFQFSFILSL